MYLSNYILYICKYLLVTGAIIGFENISVSVHESTGVAVIYVVVLNGTLGRDVTVQFSTTDISAKGEPYTACDCCMTLARMQEKDNNA